MPSCSQSDQKIFVFGGDQMSGLDWNSLEIIQSYNIFEDSWSIHSQTFSFQIGTTALFCQDLDLIVFFGRHYEATYTFDFKKIEEFAPQFDFDTGDESYQINTLPLYSPSQKKIYLLEAHGYCFCLDLDSKQWQTVHIPPVRNHSDMGEGPLVTDFSNNF